MECRMDVLNDLFMRCVFERCDAACHVCTTRKILWAANFSMAKSSCAERTILVVRILVNTWDFEKNVTVVRGFAPSALTKTKLLVWLKSKISIQFEDQLCNCTHRGPRIVDHLTV